MKPSNSKDGGALVMAMVVLLAFSILAIGLFKLHETDAVEAVFVEQSNQAFWLAETGMQQALHKLRKEKSYRDSPSALYESFGDGSYDVDVAADATTVDTWIIVSTGTVGSVSCVLELNPLLAAEIGYALMGLNGDSKLEKTGTIEDDVYSYGKLTVNGRSTPTINGEVQALDTRNLDFTPLTSDDRVEMEIDAPLTDFASAVGTPPTFIDVEYPAGSGITNTYLDLTGGKTVKISADYDFSASTIPYAEGTYGDGTLIIDGDLKFGNSLVNDFSIGDGGRVYVDGDIDAGKDGSFGADVIVYATGSMTLQKAAGSDSTSFFVEGDLTVKKDLEFNGLIFSEGSVTVDGDMTLRGSLIAGEGFWLKGGYDVDYDGTQIPDYVLENMIVYVTYSAKPGTWNEVSSF